MNLAGMIAADENALICDFAETYHIYDYRALPAVYCAVLASGLRADSRIMMKLAGMKYDIKEILLAHIADNMRLLRWGFTDDGQRGKNVPVLFTELMEDGAEKAGEYRTFGSGEEFLAAWNRSAKGGKLNG